MHPSGSTRMHIDLFCNTTADISFRAVRRKEYSTDWLASLFVLSLFFFFTHREKAVQGHFSCQFDHCVFGPFSCLEHGWQHQWGTPGHAPVHISTAGSHRVPGWLPWIRREGSHWAVNDGGPGACRWDKNGASTSVLFFHHTGQVLLLLIWYVLMACKISRTVQKVAERCVLREALLPAELHRNMENVFSYLGPSQVTASWEFHNAKRRMYKNVVCFSQFYVTVNY